MANEQNLRDRWDDVFHDTAEYRGAQKADALAAFDRQQQGRAAVAAALQTGNIRRVADLQQQLAARRPGRTAALDSYQNQRVGDYLDEARGRSNRELNDYAMGHNGPESVARGAAYASALNDPDFSQHFPYMTIRPGGGGGRGRPTGPAPGAAPGGVPVRDPAAPSAEMVAANTPTPAMNRELAQQGLAASARRIHKVQQLRTSLPPELLTVFNDAVDPRKSPNPMSLREQAQFIDSPPEVQYSMLRQRQAAKRPTGPGAPATPAGPDFLSSDGWSARSEVPRIQAPQTGQRASAQLAAPPEDYLDDDGLDPN